MILVAHPDLLSDHAEMLAGLDLAHADSRRIRQALVDWDGSRFQTPTASAQTGKATAQPGDRGRPGARRLSRSSPGWRLSCARGPLVS